VSEINERFDLNVVIDGLLMNQGAGAKRVKLAPAEKEKLGDVLRRLVEQADATYLVQREYVLVVGKRRPGK
jgi:hypothetical protein